MPGRLEGKRAFVTAAAAGIGRACAVAFAAEGARVVATDVDERGLAALRGPGIETARLDVRDTAAVQALAAAAGDVDVLLNAAGFVHHGTALDWSSTAASRCDRRGRAREGTRGARVMPARASAG